MSDLGRGNFALGWNTMQPNWKESKGRWKERPRGGGMEYLSRAVGIVGSADEQGRPKEQESDSSDTRICAKLRGLFHVRAKVLRNILPLHC